MATTTAQKQIEMHMDFFDKTSFAIENGYYMEAIFREYAAIAQGTVLCVLRYKPFNDLSHLLTKGYTI